MAAKTIARRPVPWSRRAFLSAGVCTACCGRSLSTGAAGNGRAPPKPATFSTDEVAPGIYIRRGVHEDATAQNHDAIANIGFIVGSKAVAVIDPGGSLRDGESLRAAILRTTKLPIRYVVRTHVHPDHAFGASAFTQDRPAFIGHARLAEALQQRGDYYRQRLEVVLGKEQAGSVVQLTHGISGQEKIDLGGRVLTITAHPTAHTNNDLSVSDVQTRTLFLGDLLFVHRIPSLDGSLRGWVKELAALKTLPADRAVPGHGPTAVHWPAAATDLERYLSTLLRETREAISKGLDIDAAVKTVGQSERGKWLLFDEYHGGNVTQAFKELEWE